MLLVRFGSKVHLDVGKKTVSAVRPVKLSISKSTGPPKSGRKVIAQARIEGRVGAAAGMIKLKRLAANEAMTVEAEGIRSEATCRRSRGISAEAPVRCARLVVVTVPGLVPKSTLFTEPPLPFVTSATAPPEFREATLKESPWIPKAALAGLVTLLVIITSSWQPVALQLLTLKVAEALSESPVTVPEKL